MAVGSVLLLLLVEAVVLALLESGELLLLLDELRVAGVEGGEGNAWLE